MKTEVRKILSRTFRKHWIDAFFKLAYDKKKSDIENIQFFHKWIWKTHWVNAKYQLEKEKKEKKNKNENENKNI